MNAPRLREDTLADEQRQFRRLGPGPAVAIANEFGEVTGNDTVRHFQDTADGRRSGLGRIEGHVTSLSHDLLGVFDGITSQNHRPLGLGVEHQHLKPRRMAGAAMWRMPGARSPSPSTS